MPQTQGKASAGAPNWGASDSQGPSWGPQCPASATAIIPQLGHWEREGDERKQDGGQVRLRTPACMSAHTCPRAPLLSWGCLPKCE